MYLGHILKPEYSLFHASSQPSSYYYLCGQMRKVLLDFSLLVTTYIASL